MRIISFINKKGGVGKSTIVANMAYVLNDRYGARVLVVDNDEQGNVSQFFGGQGKYSIADVLLEHVEAGEAVENTRYKGMAMKKMLPKYLTMVDSGEMKETAAYELTNLTDEEQKKLMDAMQGQEITVKGIKEKKEELFAVPMRNAIANR